MTKPQFTITTENASPTSARFVIEPLPQGFGHTLGNALRRVLYSSLPGSAITSITISGVTHQFSNLEGVKEDVVQLVLALKLVRVAYSGDKPVRIILSAKGPGPVTAAQFEVPSDIKIINTDLILAHLADKNSKLDLEATVETGLGYSPAEDRKSSTIGVIPMDATFTPVTRVNYSVDSTRVGRITNFDRLTIDVTTTGVLHPEAALKTASTILVDYFTAIVSPTADNPASSPSASGSTKASGSSISIEELDLPTRIGNALQKAGFESVGDIINTPKSQLAKIKNLGGKSVKIIEAALSERGFSL